MAISSSPTMLSIESLRTEFPGRVPADATAYAHRSSPIMTNVAAFHDGSEADRTKRPTWDRLVEIKRRYDPTNLFRLNQNIPPDSNG
jgi:FAD/FMN-containing dehydrogenase